MEPVVEGLSVKDAARLLRVSEDTVLRWVRQGVVPTHKAQGDYRFEQEELESWARRNRIGSNAQPRPTDDKQPVLLFPAVQRGGVFRDVVGDTPEAIYRAITQFFPYAREAKEVPREALLASLLEREGLVTTGVGKGVALPHPRHPQDWGLEGPTVGVFFPAKPVDFHAMDGQAVTVVFMILCTTIKSHLTMLAQVSHFVTDGNVRAFLETKPSREALLEQIRHVLPAQ
ncbi:MAG TPA: PTS sugar transporter subunit IIA [bacterium]